MAAVSSSPSASVARSSAGSLVRRGMSFSSLGGEEYEHRRKAQNPTQKISRNRRLPSTQRHRYPTTSPPRAYDINRGFHEWSQNDFKQDYGESSSSDTAYLLDLSKSDSTEIKRVGGADGKKNIHGLASEAGKLSSERSPPNTPVELQSQGPRPLRRIKAYPITLSVTQQAKRDYKINQYLSRESIWPLHRPQPDGRELTMEEAIRLNKDKKEVIIALYQVAQQERPLRFDNSFGNHDDGDRRQRYLACRHVLPDRYEDVDPTQQGNRYLNELGQFIDWITRGKEREKLELDTRGPDPGSLSQRSRKWSNPFES